MTSRLPPLSIRTRLTLWYSAILLTILIVISGLGYSVLRWSLIQDLDASLLTVAQVLRDTSLRTQGMGSEAEADALLRELLGPEFYDKFFQLFDLEGHPEPWVFQPRARALTLSPQARAAAGRGFRTFETVRMDGADYVRLLTMPVVQSGRVTQIVQVGMPLRRAQTALGRYVDTLVVLIPLGVALAAAGGAIIARTALRPVHEMTLAARRITADDLGQRISLRGTADELDRLAETLNGMLVRLAAAFAEMRRFAADAAHELRTPLTALKGGIEVSLRADRSAQEYRQVLISSLEEVERLIRLAEDLLLLSRATAGPETPRGSVELEPLLLEVFDVGARLAQGTGVSVRINDVSPARVRGDALALRRALRNLVENAVKYTPAGGKVELSLTSGDGHASLAVQDTGIGMAPADTARIFEPFVRLDAARGRETGGAGLGLAIARAIVLSHGGIVTLESQPGAGSRFTIRLPLA
ncbi:MAG TPA: ATP-binding protein [Methylomirabilota bacterium]|jgi:heavy metal sensor kinase|nr:ATP-binding protein [Methylomirabilota bacterium]